MSDESSVGDRITPPSSPAVAATALKMGHRVQFAESRRWWRVRATSGDGRFAILTSPFNLRRVPYYTILDTERGVRGPDDRIFCSGYEDDGDIADRMRELIAGDIHVSRRPSKCLETRVVAVLPPTDRHTPGPIPPPDTYEPVFETGHDTTGVSRS